MLEEFKNAEITIRSVDTGGGIVIIGSNSYWTKVLLHVEDSECYKELKNNPVNEIKSEIKSLFMHAGVALTSNMRD